MGYRTIICGNVKCRKKIVTNGGGNHKYCCDKCRYDANFESMMAKQKIYRKQWLNGYRKRERIETKRRECLNCGGSFRSEGIGNRICIRCKGLETHTDVAEYRLAGVEIR